MEKEKDLTKMEETATKKGEAVKEEETIEMVDFMKFSLSKTYDFEGEKISELDLKGLEDLTGADMIAIHKMMRRRGNTDASPEMTMEYSFFAAMQATGKPLEFFLGLSAKDSMKVKTRVNYFFMY